MQLSPMEQFSGNALAMVELQLFDGRQQQGKIIHYGEAQAYSNMVGKDNGTKQLNPSPA